MHAWSPEAKRIHKALLDCGLETAFQLPQKEINNNKRKQLIAQHIASIMQLLDLNLNDPSLSQTPQRIAKMYVDEIFSGLNYANFPQITLIDNIVKTDEIIIVRNINLTSICEHHFLMIDGKATVAYIPQNKVIGLSKINRIVQFFSHRPQVQERLIQQIFIALQILLHTTHVAVSIEATHYCVKGRGVRDVTSSTITTSLGGLFKSSDNTRKEFLQSIKHT
ncbi:GTP cyclohydrolase I FolE [Candidatus Erwinia haradaeae]|uniref:GTP cyclohydrolase 1 n=1 Tax=Candidatus Erwinia haradaeae TaxID=1922217 RepID=A0A451DI65_9GAMM|nr:GTP cyclohydrolase I FolE [Candidatus Erwinia haradaeae]VFP86343.1 GTP cyclohydrolase 1 [Candidatus Erwinia haradaeae]